MNTTRAQGIQGIEMTLPVGDKIKFRCYRQRFTIRARDERYAICTKPFNPKKTVMYTIVDLERGVRGPEDLIFGRGVETDKECNEMLQRLISGESEVSYRHCINLDIES